LLYAFDERIYQYYPVKRIEGESHELPGFMTLAFDSMRQTIAAINTTGVPA